jgi:hypothetical protein
MSTISMAERESLEKLFGMTSGYVLNFSDPKFGEFVRETVGINIDDERYCADGTSKAKKLRTFWKLEPDYTVGRLIRALIDYNTSINANRSAEAIALTNNCLRIASRLLSSPPTLDPLKEHAAILNANHLAEQIRRMEESVETDPSLAIGTAKELIETCCKTILAERGKPGTGAPSIPELTKLALKELNLVPSGIPDAARGVDVIRRLLSNLGTIGNGLAELRGLYGTGHGKHGRSAGLGPRHAKLAIGAAATLAVFLFETHNETRG